MSGWNTDFTDGRDFKGTVKVPHEKLGQTQPDSRQVLQANISTYLPDPSKDDDAREELMPEDAAIRVAALQGSATLAAGQAFADAQTGSEKERNEQARARLSERTNALASLKPGARVTIGEPPKPKPKPKEKPRDDWEWEPGELEALAETYADDDLDAELDAEIAAYENDLEPTEPMPWENR